MRLSGRSRFFQHAGLFPFRKNQGTLCFCFLGILCNPGTLDNNWRFSGPVGFSLWLHQVKSFLLIFLRICFLLFLLSLGKCWPRENPDRSLLRLESFFLFSYYSPLPPNTSKSEGLPIDFHFCRRCCRIFHCISSPPKWLPPLDARRFTVVPLRWRLRLSVFLTVRPPYQGSFFPLSISPLVKNPFSRKRKLSRPQYHSISQTRRRIWCPFGQPRRT